MTAPALPTAPRLAAILSAKVQGDGTEYTALLRQLSGLGPDKSSTQAPRQSIPRELGLLLD